MRLMNAVAHSYLVQRELSAVWESVIGTTDRACYVLPRCRVPYGRWSSRDLRHTRENEVPVAGVARFRAGRLKTELRRSRLRSQIRYDPVNALLARFYLLASIGLTVRIFLKDTHGKFGFRPVPQFHKSLLIRDAGLTEMRVLRPSAIRPAMAVAFSESTSRP